MTIRPLTGHHLEFLGLKGGCTGSPESTLVKTPHYWKSHVPAQILSAKHLQLLYSDLFKKNYHIKVKIVTNMQI